MAHLPGSWTEVNKKDSHGKRFENSLAGRCCQCVYSFKQPSCLEICKITAAVVDDALLKVFTSCNPWRLCPCLRRKVVALWMHHLLWLVRSGNAWASCDAIFWMHTGLKQLSEGRLVFWLLQVVILCRSNLLIAAAVVKMPGDTKLPLVSSDEIDIELLFLVILCLWRATREGSEDFRRKGCKKRFWQNTSKQTKSRVTRWGGVNANGSLWSLDWLRQRDNSCKHLGIAESLEMQCFVASSPLLTSELGVMGMTLRSLIRSRGGRNKCHVVLY